MQRNEKDSSLVEDNRERGKSKQKEKQNKVHFDH